MKVFWTIVSVLIFLLVIGFTMLNIQHVTLNFYLIRLHWPLSVVVIASFILGGIIGLCIGYCRGCCRSKKRSS